MKTESLCLHAGYEPGNGEPRVVPIVQSTTFKYSTTAEVAKLFDLAEAGFFYSRLGNPTVDAVEQKIAALEGGVGALCTSSGQAASMLSLLNVAQSGDHVVSAASIYGGTFNLFAVTLKKLGIEVTFVDQNASDAELEKAFRPNTRAVFGETLSNPSMDVLDIERFANLAHKHRLPLIIDNTFAPKEHRDRATNHVAVLYGYFRQDEQEELRQNYIHHSTSHFWQRAMDYFHSPRTPCRR